LWVAIAGFVNLKQRVALLRASSGRSFGSQLTAIPRGYYGMLLAHLGVAVFITVLAYYMLGDALRDALDPRLRGR